MNYTGTPRDRLLAKMRDIKGAGDAVAIVAKPVAYVLDATIGTNFVNCGKCGQRQRALNEKFPNPLAS